jgi:solute carrier family 25 protein 33/36
MTSTLTNPIWVVKTRLQLDKSADGARRYTDSLDCLLQIYRQEGIRGFARGLSASYLGISEGVLQWVLYEKLKRVMRTKDERPGTLREKVSEALGAGFCAKLIATVATYPHEVCFRGKRVVDVRLLERDYARRRRCTGVRSILGYLMFSSRYFEKKG